MKLDRSRCRGCGFRFSVTNLFVNLILAVIKALVGFFSGSRALQAGALYSVNDVLSAIIVMVSLKIGKRPPDKKHAYGYGKAEFIALGTMSFVLVGGVFFIVYYSVVDILRGVDAPPHAASLGVALLTLATNEFLARKGYCAARHHNNSLALHTSAEHNRADALSSLAVLVGVGGATLGFHVLDQIVAIFETVHICWLSGTLFGKSIKGLMDAALPPEELERIDKACRRVPGVIDLISLRSRAMGTTAWVDATVTVSAELTVEQAHEIVEKLRAEIREVMNREIDALVAFKSAAPKTDSGPLGRIVEDHA
ncbi:MAG: cation transporter [Deltaproteobacteria bacterium]|nr:cation transporter [Deltaproteobacteria bacterium]